MYGIFYIVISMKLEQYKQIRSAITTVIGIAVAIAVVQDNIFLALVAVTIGVVALYLSRRRLTEIEQDERTILIRSKAASTTLAITTVAMAIIGLSLVFLSRQWIDNYEQIGYLLAFQANFILALNALLNYYYRNKLGG